MSAHNQEMRPFTAPQVRIARLRFPNWTRFRLRLIIHLQLTLVFRLHTVAAYAVKSPIFCKSPKLRCLCPHRASSPAVSAVGSEPTAVHPSSLEFVPPQALRLSVPG